MQSVVARSTDCVSRLVFGVRVHAPRSGCPINPTLEVLGDRWSLIVIRDLMSGNRRHLRGLLTRSDERIAPNILADRLARLEKAGLVSRRDDPSHKAEGHSQADRSIHRSDALAGVVPRTRCRSAPRASMPTTPPFHPGSNDGISTGGRLSAAMDSALTPGERLGL